MDQRSTSVCPKSTGRSESGYTGRVLRSVSMSVLWSGPCRVLVNVPGGTMECVR